MWMIPYQMQLWSRTSHYLAKNFHTRDLTPEEAIAGKHILQHMDYAIPEGITLSWKITDSSLCLIHQPEWLKVPEWDREVYESLWRSEKNRDTSFPGVLSRYHFCLLRAVRRFCLVAPIEERSYLLEVQNILRLSQEGQAVLSGSLESSATGEPHSAPQSGSLGTPWEKQRCKEQLFSLGQHDKEAAAVSAHVHHNLLSWTDQKDMAALAWSHPHQGGHACQHCCDSVTKAFAWLGIFFLNLSAWTSQFQHPNGHQPAT